MTTIDRLAGRMAKCGYPCGSQPVPSHQELAFFVFRGDGSNYATETCTCRMRKVAHIANPDKFDHEFEPIGPAEFDEYYNGCRGWD